MKSPNFFILALVALLVTAALPTITLADSSYVSVYSNWVSNGAIVPANGCSVIFALTNGSGSVHVEVQSPSYTTQDVTISPGNTYYYYDALLITVVKMDDTTGKAWVDIAKPTTTSGTTQTGTKVYCDTPGQLALAGDTVTFPVVIQNYDADHTYTLSASNDAGWTTSFQYNGRNIYQLFVPQGQSRTVNLLAQTSYSTPVGEKHVTAKADSNSLSLGVTITSANSSAQVSTQVSSVIAALGGNIYYDLSIQNTQAQDNDYKLSVTGLPDNWYYRYVAARSSTDEMSEAVVPAATTKNLVLQILPPLSAQQGDYNFTAVVTTPDGVSIQKDLTLKLKGAANMAISSDQLAYSSKPGQAFNIKVYVTNSGQGDALANVYPDISAPTGWTVNTTPSMVNSIKAGETQVFTVSVVPPANIVASDYDVKINMKSDQAQSSSDYRITISTDSYIPYIGVGIVLLIVASLGIMYRKYGRR